MLNWESVSPSIWQFRSRRYPTSYQEFVVGSNLDGKFFKHKHINTKFSQVLSLSISICIYIYIYIHIRICRILSNLHLPMHRCRHRHRHRHRPPRPTRSPEVHLQPLQWQRHLGAFHRQGPASPGLSRDGVVLQTRSDQPGQNPGCGLSTWDLMWILWWFHGILCFFLIGGRIEINGMY